MDLGLSNRWQKELAILYRAAQALWMAQAARERDGASERMSLRHRPSASI